MENEKQITNAESTLPESIVSDENVFDLSIGDDTISDDVIETQTDDANTDESVPLSESNKEVQESVGDAKEDPTRFEHWQSKFDKESQRANQLNTELNDLQERMSSYEAYVQNSSMSQNQQGQQPAENAVTIPERPVKPSDYDPTDAVTDPESESYKYRDAMDTYQADVAEYSLKMEEQRIVQQQQLAEQQQYSSFLNNVRGEVVSYGLPSDNIDDFVDAMGRQEGVTIKNLTTLYMLERGLMKAVPVNHTTGISDGIETPLPASLQSGEAQEEITDEQAFNLGLMG